MNTIKFVVAADKTVKGSKPVVFKVTRLQMMTLVVQMVALAEREYRFHLGQEQLRTISTGSR